MAKFNLIVLRWNSITAGNRNGSLLINTCHLYHCFRGRRGGGTPGEYGLEGGEGTAEAGVLKGRKTGEKCYLGREQRENVRELGKMVSAGDGRTGQGRWDISSSPHPVYCTRASLRALYLLERVITLTAVYLL